MTGFPVPTLNSFPRDIPLAADGIFGF